MKSIIFNKFKLVIFIFFIFFLNTCLATKIQLELVDYEKTKNGSPIVYRGEIFKIKVVVSKTGQSISDLNVYGLENFNIHGTSRSTSITMRNSRFLSKTVNIYDLSASNIGNFKIGPAVIKHNNKEIKSTPEFINIKVKKRKAGSVAKSNVNDNSSQQDSSYELFCKLETNKKNVFVGQPIEVCIKIYSRGNILQVGIKPPKFQGFFVKEIRQVIKKQQHYENKLYSVLEKRFILFPIEAGQKSLDPVEVNFTIPKKKGRMLGFFDFDEDPNSFFGPKVESKRAFSNNLKLNVNSLPDYNGQIDAIGQFNYFKISVDKKEAIINEPILLKVVIDGIANLDQIVSPKLNLPNFFNIYESKSNVQDNLTTSFNGGKKVFEFVLQVGKVGHWKIPVQKFVFFDVNDKSYKIIHSKSIELNIKNPPNLPVSNDEEILDNNSHNNLDVKKIENAENQPFINDINFIEESFELLKNNFKKPLSFTLFLFLLFIPFLFYFYKILYLIFLNLKTNIFNKPSKKKIFLKLKKQLDLITKNNEADKLYDFFINFFTLISEKDLINEKIIENLLNKKSWDKEKIEDFLSFLNECASLSFAADVGIYKNEKLLIKKARNWFIILETDLSNSVLKG